MENKRNLTKEEIEEIHEKKVKKILEFVLKYCGKEENKEEVD